MTQVFEALKLSKVHLLGHSMGACLVSLIAGIVPKKILSLSLIEGLGPLSHPEDTACSQLTNYVDYITQTESKPVKGYNHPDKAALARASRGYVSFEIAKTLCARGIFEKDGQFFWRHDKRLLIPSPLRMTQAQVLSCLQQITAKTCLLWASEGFSFNSELMQERIKAVPHLKIEHMKGGHHIHMERPEQVGSFLSHFISNYNY